MERKDTLQESDLYNWGTSLLSHRLVEQFDNIRQMKDIIQKEVETRAYTKLLLISLSDKYKIDKSKLANIRFDIIPPQNESDQIIPVDPDLLKIRDLLMHEYGFQIVRRLNISMHRNKHDYSHPLSVLIEKNLNSQS